MNEELAPPGFASGRLIRLIRERIAEMRLDLRGVEVLTEAATGAYTVTPVIAALAGAHVVAVSKDSRYGTFQDVVRSTMALADLAGVADRVALFSERTPEQFARADLVTNSGHLRPIIGEFAEAIRPGSALSLMFETWEIQAGRVDVDLEGIIDRGVRVAGTNERHPHVDVFSYLGPMAVAQLNDAGLPAYSQRIGVLCDNPFARYIERGLTATGALVVVGRSVADLPLPDLDAVVVAMTPTGSSVLSPAALRSLAAARPDIVLMQYWGDIDRRQAALNDIRVWPPTAPAPGHMGVLPSRVGPDAIVRLQAGGLKVGELLLRESVSLTKEDQEYLDELR